MNKNHGFVTIYIAMGILLITSIILAISYFPIINSISSIKLAEKSINPYIENRIGLERLYGNFYENISYNETTEYPDISKTYKLHERDIRFRDVNVKLVGGGEEDFYILNKTNIIIDVDFEKNNNLLPHQDSYYTLDLLYEGVSILDNKYKERFMSGIIVEIPNTFTYSEDAGTFNYGKYTLIVNVVNGNIESNIKYKEQSYRELEIIENEDITRILVLENNTSIGGNIKRYLKKL